MTNQREERDIMLLSAQDAVNAQRPQKPALPAMPVDDYDPLNDVGQDELIMPVVKPVQGTSRTADTKHIGEFYDTINETYSPSLTIAVLVLRRQRSLFVAGVFDQPPLCSSDDAVSPLASVEAPDGHMTGPTCVECPFSRWGSAGEGRKGQACQYSYSLICQNLETQAPFLLRIHGASLKPWRLYMSRIKQSRKPLYSFETKVSLVSQTFDAGKAYVMQFGRGDNLLATQAQEMRALIDLYRNVALPQEYSEEQTSFIEADGLEESVLD